MWYVFLFIIDPMVKGRILQSVHQQSLRGGGKTQWVISLFGKDLLPGRELGEYETFFWKSDTIFSAEALPGWVTSHKSGSKGIVGL